MLNLKSLIRRKRLKISIIIPIYNSEEFLQTCMDSIVRQDIAPIEIIAVDDCSSDGSPRILDDYKARFPNIRVVRNKANLGPGATRNIALGMAHGDYLAFIDSDDWIYDDYLVRLYEQAKISNADIVFSNMKRFSYGIEHEYRAFDVVATRFNKQEISIKDLPNEWHSTAPWMKLFKRSFVVRNKLEFCNDAILGEDIPFTWIAYFKAEIISFCNEAYYVYNARPESLDRNISDTIFDIFKSLDHTRLNYKKIDPVYSRLSQLDTLYVSHLYYQFSKLCAKQSQNSCEYAHKYWKKARKELTDIKPKHIIDNAYLSDASKNFYRNVIKHIGFDKEMRDEYLSVDKNKQN